MKQYAASLLDAVCPNWCELCNGEIKGAGCVCTACAIELGSRFHQPFCKRCGASIGPFGSSDPCSNCPPHRPAFDCVIRVAAYEGQWRTLIQRFKYTTRRRQLELLADELAGAIQRSDLYDTIDACTVTPTCWRHRLARPFYPAEHLAALTAKRCRIPLARLLGRRFSPHQTGLTATARIANVRGKFFLLPGRRLIGARICLIDDVLTTGATVSQCARVLKSAGAAHVCVAVLARTANHPAAIAAS